MRAARAFRSFEPAGVNRVTVFDRVVAGVDGSDYGLEALQQALTLLAPGGKLVALTVLENDRAALLDPDEPRSPAEAAESARTEAAALLEGRPSCEAHVVDGDVLETLLSHAERDRATLVAVGTRRRSRAVGMLLGSTSTGLLRDAPCPVLLARPRWGRIWTPRRILVGVDGSSHSLVALETADDLAARLGSVVTVLAATAGKRIETEGVWAKRVEEWVPDRPVTALLDRSAGADLIVVGSRGLHGLRSLGSVSERVAHNALCSVLVVRPLEQPSERAS